MEAERLESSAGLPYLLFRPREVPADGAPLIVFLHGWGERIQPGKDPDELLCSHSLPALARDGDLPFLVACPQTAHEKWEPEIGRLTALADELVESEGAHHERRYLTGISMGATGVWRTAARSPGAFAALVPVSASVPRGAWRVRTPVWVWVGEDDHWTRGKPVERRLYRLRRRDDRARFTCVPGAKHEGAVWNDIYGRAELYEWLLRWPA